MSRARSFEQASARERDLEICIGFLRDGARPPLEVTCSFSDEHKGEFGVESICTTLQLTAAIKDIAGDLPPSLTEVIARGRTLTRRADDVLSCFAMTILLLPRIRHRVVTVSSVSRRAGAIDLDDPNWTRRPYRAQSAYGQSKLANLLFTAELEWRLAALGSPVLAMAGHPGLAASNLLRNSRRSRLVGRAERGVVRALGQDAEAGALPTLQAAVADFPRGQLSRSSRIPAGPWRVGAGGSIPARLGCRLGPAPVVGVGGAHRRDIPSHRGVGGALGGRRWGWAVRTGRVGISGSEDVH